MSKKEVSLKGSMDVKSVITYMEDLVASMKAGTVVVQRGDEHVTLKPMSPVEVEIEAEQKKGKETLLIELAWRTELPSQGESVKLIISSKEPEPKPEHSADANKSNEPAKASASGQKAGKA